ncbi:MAG: hypothetical protein AAGD05_06730 [Bacteroidota bacterium]
MSTQLKFSKITLLIIMALAVFSACQKEEVQPLSPANPTSTSFFQLQSQRTTTNGNTGGAENDLDMDCFTFVYPITVQLPDGSTATADSNEALESIFDNWWTQNPNAIAFPTFSFPLQVMLSDGSNSTINDEETLCTLLETCWGDNDWDDDFEFSEVFCFELVYPVELSFPDGTTQSAGDEEMLVNAITNWLIQNPDSEAFPTFTYPIEVMTDAGQQSIGSDGELEAIFETCYEYGDYEELCFTLNYPVQLIFPDGTTADVETDEALETRIEDWYQQNPTAEEDPTFAYPIEVTLEDGTTQTVNNDEALDQLFDACFDDECQVNGERLLLGDHEVVLTRAILQRR